MYRVQVLGVGSWEQRRRGIQEIQPMSDLFSLPYLSLQFQVIFAICIAILGVQCTYYVLPLFLMCHYSFFPVLLCTIKRLNLLTINFQISSISTALNPTCIQPLVLQSLYYVASYLMISTHIPTFEKYDALLSPITN